MLADASDAFVEAWMRCLNTPACRRMLTTMLGVTVRSITYETRTFGVRLQRVLQRGEGVCVVKRFGEDECHWVYMRRRKKKVYIYDTSDAYDMSDVVAQVRRWYEVCHVPCPRQTDDDSYCQTWSLMMAHRDMTKGKDRVDDFAHFTRLLWKHARFRQWMQHEMNYT